MGRPPKSSGSQKQEAREAGVAEIFETLNTDLLVRGKLARCLLNRHYINYIFITPTNIPLLNTQMANMPVSSSHSFSAASDMHFNQDDFGGRLFLRKQNLQLTIKLL